MTPAAGKRSEVVGQRFGNYRAIRLLGEGGFGSVYVAEHPVVARKAAVKVLHAPLANDPDLLARFLNEARAASEIRHPHIVEVFDAGVTADGTPYILMELLEGESLRARIRRLQRLPVNSAIRFAVEIGQALHAAHQAGIVHRDLKPENIFVVPGDWPQEHVKILDFGIAKLSQRTGVEAVKTLVGVSMGSPAYMSPEQWTGDSAQDHRTDVYALGAILLEMIAGRPPFQATSALELRQMHMSAPPPRLTDLVADAPAHLDAVVCQAMAKNPAQRYRDMAELVAALSGVSAAAGATMWLAPAVPTVVQSGPAVTTMSTGTGERTASKTGVPSQRRRLLVTAGLSLSVAVAVVASTRFRRHPAPSAEPAPAIAAALPTTRLPSDAAVAAVEPPLFRLRLRSQPSGATATDLRSGRLLGKTPIELPFSAKDRPSSIRLRKTGWRSKTVEVPRHGDMDEEVVLEKAITPTEQQGSVVL